MGHPQACPGGHPGGHPQACPGGHPAAAPMPHGQEQLTDPASGRPYFVNRATGETSWTPPGPPQPTAASAPTPAPAPAPAAIQGGPPLPPGWEQVTDPTSGKPYFCNRSTGVTSWTPPQL